MIFVFLRAPRWASRSPHIDFVHASRAKRNRQLRLKRDSLSPPDYPRLGVLPVAENAHRRTECKSDSTSCPLSEIKCFDDVSRVTFRYKYAGRVSGHQMSRSPSRSNLSACPSSANFEFQTLLRLSATYETFPPRFRKSCGVAAYRVAANIPDGFHRCAIGHPARSRGAINIHIEEHAPKSRVSGCPPRMPDAMIRREYSERWRDTAPNHSCRKLVMATRVLPEPSKSPVSMPIPHVLAFRAKPRPALQPRPTSLNLPLPQIAG